MTKAVLISYPDEHVLQEAVSLAEAGGYDPVAILTQRYLLKAKYGVGEGKAEEASRAIRESGAETLIFDERLSASQSYNLAKLCKVEVKDREKLILEIFAKRATTAEAKLQVQLAELNYELPKARDMVRMAKAGEQPGFFGLGKYEVDVYVKMIKRRITTLSKKVEEVGRRREVFRRGRERAGFPTVALTGYTGAGKTTLFNRLTGEAKDVDAGVFTTLAPTTRAVKVGGAKVLLSDTVGFISRLPTYLIEAFKSTLEEVAQSTVVLLIVDSSLPEDMLAMNFRSCVETLTGLGVGEGKVLTVMNKTDLISQEELGERMWSLGLKGAPAISAKSGAGVAELLRQVGSRLAAPTEVGAVGG